MPLFLALPFIALAPHTGAYPSPGPGLNDAVRMVSVERTNATVTWNNTVEWNQAGAAEETTPRRSTPPSARANGRAASRSASSNWEGVAACESGGNWSTSTGNGYYGGLQMTLDFWHSHGGDQYASRPDLATKAEQIAVAEQAGSRSPWPVCGGR